MSDSVCNEEPSQELVYRESAIERADWSPWLSRYWEFQIDHLAESPYQHHVPPDGCLSFLVAYSKGGDFRKTLLLGPRTQPLIVPIDHPSHYFGVRFWPHALGCFQSTAQCPLTEFVGPVSAAFPQWDTIAQQHLPDCWREDVFNGINDFLAAILNDASQPDPIAMAITDAIIRQSESLQLQTLADELDVSVRQMQRRFRNATGLTCKQFQQIRRFRMALAELVIPERKDSSVIALDAGFFDQSHLINQVRSYMDLTVQQFQEKHDEITRQDILP